MTLSSKIRVGDDVFDKAVLPAATKEDEEPLNGWSCAAHLPAVWRTQRRRSSGDVYVGANGAIITNGSFSSGIVAESIGGGGGGGG